jgi:hypothetical protein
MFGCEKCGSLLIVIFKVYAPQLLHCEQCFIKWVFMLTFELRILLRRTENSCDREKIVY